MKCARSQQEEKMEVKQNENRELKLYASFYGLISTTVPLGASLSISSIS